MSDTLESILERCVEGSGAAGVTAPVLLCADDYGLAPGICDAIETLIGIGRLWAASCMTTLPDWARRAAGLRALVDRHPADIGLHLTLTEQPPLTSASGLASGGRLPPPPGLLARALARRLPERALEEEVRAQFDAFEDACGGPLDHVDGHQHVHMLPSVRDVLMREIETRYPPGRVWVRDCRETLERCLARRVAFTKACLIGLLGQALGARLERAGVPHNREFSGLLDFFGRTEFGALIRRFLMARGPRPLVHVHPGWVDGVLQGRDRLTDARRRELEYLASARFAEDLEAAAARPARFQETSG